MHPTLSFFDFMRCEQLSEGKTPGSLSLKEEP